MAIIALPMVSIAQTKNQSDQLGRKQGLWEKSYPNGTLIYSGTFKDDYPIGEMKRFHSNGILKAKLFFTNKGTRAKTELYNESLQLVAKGNFIQSKKDSVWLYFDKNKRIRASETFNKGVKTGKSVYYFTDGSPAETIYFANNERNGSWKRFFKNGNAYFEANYQNGKLEGPAQSYFSNGNIEFSGHYRNNLRDGKWEFYSNTGTLLYSAEYKNGIASNQDEIDKIQQNTLKEMEKQNGNLVDPEKFVDDPDSYLRSQRQF
ncbi:toxin-antitoxin system YwqK family antitoxin [Labilibaculum sp.]|uniref:toxin-antitoxin system YwqK family antitoxin n=1 Tax=Labilibaculum sp. TaxID=2060723 RepID=UPI00356B3C4A